MAVKDQLVLLIDASEDMFRELNDDVPFLQCMKVQLCVCVCVCVCV